MAGGFRRTQLSKVGTKRGPPLPKTQCGGLSQIQIAGAAGRSAKLRIRIGTQKAGEAAWHFSHAIPKNLPK